MLCIRMPTRPLTPRPSRRGKGTPPMSKNPQAPIDFQVHRDDFRDCRVVPGAAIEELEDGQVLIRVDRIAQT